MASAKSTKNGTKPSPFQYGFKVHSLTQVSSPSKLSSPNRKNQKRSPNRRQQQQQPNPIFSGSPKSIELYCDSVSRLLDDRHLNARSATSFHDLQCGTATVALQAFLAYPNLRRVFGIEQNKNLFHFATQNLMALVKNGYKDSRYLLVEQIPNQKMTIAQKSSPSELAQKSFKVGEVVYCYVPLKSNNIKKRDNYQGIVKGADEDGIHYDVELSATKKVKRVHKESMFKPGTERTFEVAKGNLFERSDSFRSDIIMLPFSVSNDSFRSLLLTGCKRSPIRSRILSYSHLEDWDGFPQFTLRRVDANIYDSDRYDSNLSPHHQLYLYQHVLSLSAASSPKEIAMHCALGSAVKVRDPQQQQWFAAKVIAINNSTKMITLEKYGFLEGTEREDVKIDEQRVHLIRRLFKVGDLVTSYCPKMIETNHDSMYQLYRSQVVALNVDGTYAVQYQDGETHPKVDGCYIFKAAKHRFEEGQLCMALRYDKVEEFNEDEEMVNIKESTKNGQSVARDQCIIRHINADGSYRIEFMNDKQYPYHDSFCESWLRPMDDLEDMKLQQSIRLPRTLEIDYDQVMMWRPNVVAHWLRKCGVSKRVSEILEGHKVNGAFLCELDADLLMNDMKLGQKETLRILQYVKALRAQMNLVGDDEEDEDDLTHISLEINQCDADMKELEGMTQETKMKLDELMTSKADEYQRYKDWELKSQCHALKNRKVGNKEIAQQLKKSVGWVGKTLKVKKLKKPGGNVMKEIESLQAEIAKYNKQLQEKQTQMAQAKHRLSQIIKQ